MNFYELVEKWRREAAEYPVDTDHRAHAAAVAVRLCADELLAALRAPAVTGEAELRDVARDIGTVRDVAARRYVAGNDHAEREHRQMLARLGQWQSRIYNALAAPPVAGGDAMPEIGWAEEMRAETAAWSGSCDGCPYPDTCSWFRRCTFRRRQEGQ